MVQVHPFGLKSKFQCILMSAEHHQSDASAATYESLKAYLFFSLWYELSFPCPSGISNHGMTLVPCDPSWYVPVVGMVPVVPFWAVRTTTAQNHMLSITLPCGIESTSADKTQPKQHALLKGRAFKTTCPIFQERATVRIQPPSDV
jgi:hypothetical protein